MLSGTRLWVRLDDPGKLHIRRWHMVKRLVTKDLASYCGRIVTEEEQLTAEPGEGPVCDWCRNAATVPAVVISDVMPPLRLLGAPRP